MTDPEALYQEQKAELERILERTRKLDMLLAALAGIFFACAASVRFFLDGPGISMNGGVSPSLITRHAHPILGTVVAIAAFAFFTPIIFRKLRIRRSRQYWDI
jgi:hypothetical protein